MIATDLVRAVAVLALDYDVITARRAVEIIEASQGESATVIDLLAREVDPIKIMRAIAAELSMPFLDLYSPRLGYRLDENVLRQFDMEVLRSYGALPLVSTDGDILAVIANPSDMDLRQYLTGKIPTVTFALAPRDQILSRLALARSGLTEEIPEVETPESDRRAAGNVVVATGPRSPLVGWFDSLLESAVAQNASDIHLELQADQSLLVRLRVDGSLRQVPVSLRGREMEVLGLVMNKAELDAANFFEPQDGQFAFTTSNRNVDVRVAMIPQVTGPMIVLRLLDSANVRRRLADMGFSSVQLEAMRASSGSNQGMVVVSGPTGSGKTTTLYALLREANSVERKVISIEDPVEYRLPLVSQIQVRNNPTRPLTFARALRAVLRMDPDVILVGEVRDAETARTALDAAITGHLVFTTVHAKDALGAFSRLIEIGAPSYLVAEAITLSVAQRLVRRVHDCATLGAPDPRELAIMAGFGVDAPDRVLKARGCDGCGGTGYRGRIAVVEVLTPSSATREMIRLGASREALASQARADGLMSLADNAARLIGDQITTVDEVYRMLERSD
jgi:type IV pilus assembly protein PilB